VAGPASKATAISAIDGYKRFDRGTDEVVALWHAKKLVDLYPV
jgi:hypothetical protein